MKNNLLIFALAVFAFSLISSANVALATVGGPTYIYNFKYNPQDESVYYTKSDFGGRGCPPELRKMSLSTGVHSTVYSCEQGEKLLSGGEYDVSKVNAEINRITAGFKDLTSLSLKKSAISIDVNFVRSEKDSEYNEIQRSLFTASVYQGGNKVTDLSIQGCNLEQPFLFEGYSIPGFDKKIALLLSTKGDCFEGGYIGETLHVVGGVLNLDKSSYTNSYKGESALVPHEGTLLIFEADTPSTSNSATSTPTENAKNFSPLIVSVIVVILILGGILLGRVTKTN